MPSPWVERERIVFGEVQPCWRCHLTGKVPAPKLTSAETGARRVENLRRAARGEELLERPSRTTECPICAGKGVLPAGTLPPDPDAPELAP